MQAPLLSFLFTAACLALVSVVAAAPVAPPAERIAQIAKMLPEQPQGLGRPASDRAAWDVLAKNPVLADVVKNAEPLLTQPLPDRGDEFFLQYTKTGDRNNWQRISGQRRGRVAPLVLAECIENKGRFIPALETLIKSLCEERTWVMSAHDGKLDNFNGKIVDIDLGSSTLGWSLAMADYLVGDKLSPQCRALLKTNLRNRILVPFEDMVNGKRTPNWWMQTTNNWNAVCFAGAVGTALIEAESREERALFIATAEFCSQYFLSGFTADGYCSEGLGYWNYGFGHFVLLSEIVRQATGGQLELLALPEARKPAEFAANIQVIGGVSPAFADCSVNAAPDSRTMYYLNRRFGFGLSQYDDLRIPLSPLQEAMIYLFPNGVSQVSASAAKATTPIRSWFDKAGILISRPQPGSDGRMGVALKGGNNNEHHNHNDVGSFVVVVGTRPVLLDPGGETYTARTFSSRRYESNLLNSYGHPVPVVAGQLQATGGASQGKVLKTQFTDDTDLLQLDISSAYRVPELESLLRTYEYSRKGAGSLIVKDEVAFKTPKTFSTALLTLGNWQQTGPNTLVAYHVEEAVTVEIDTGGKPFTLRTEEIKEDGSHPIRLGIDLNEPVTEATVTVKIKPMANEAPDGGLLRNGDFELQGWCWDIPRDGRGAISQEQAASGKYSLKVTDLDKNAGSNIRSARIAVAKPGKYQLKGKIFHTQGNGVGMYMYYYDEAGTLLNQVDAQGNMAGIGTPQGAVGRWADFSFPFETPKGTKTMQIWIHSYNGAVVEAYLDDLQIVPVGQ